MISPPKFTITLVVWFSIFGCVIDTPLKGPGIASGTSKMTNSAGTVFVSLTKAVLVNDPKLRAIFWSYVGKVEASLPEHPGFVGYSKRTRLFGNEAWTMTIWTDEKSLNDFVEGDVHQTAIRESIHALASATFARVELNREEIPLSWERALQFLDKNGWQYHQRLGNLSDRK